jgi:hypothetical protein
LNCTTDLLERNDTAKPQPAATEASLRVRLFRIVPHLYCRHLACRTVGYRFAMMYIPQKAGADRAIDIAIALKR